MTAPAPRSRTRLRRPAAPPARRIAIVGAGMAGVACARTLMQAGHEVTVFEREAQPGGRMATHMSSFGGFDAGAQYFTVRDHRFERALQTVPGQYRPWSATTVRVLDAAGRVAAAAPPPRESHWVAQPGMQSLVATWASPIAQAGRLHAHTRVVRLERDRLQPLAWQLDCETEGGSRQVHAGFDAVLFAQPAPQTRALLEASEISTALHAPLSDVSIAPCWTLMLAFPQAVQPGLTTLGPQWNAARSTHHRIAWLARESSKPGRSQIERWTVQASPAWSQEHLGDDPQRVQAKLHRAFSEVTGIRAEPTWAEVRRWRYAQTTAALGRSHLWDSASGLGACGDWCLGHRVEDAFVSGLELALAVA